MDEQKEAMNEREIRLLDLWTIFKKRFWLMLLAAVVAVAGFWGYVKLTYQPMYESTAILYVLRQEGTQQTDSSLNASFTIATNTVNDCTYFFKSPNVLNGIIRDLGLEQNAQQLAKRISTRNPEDSRVLEVTVKAETPQLAKQIVTEVCERGIVVIDEAMGFKQVNLLQFDSDGELSPEEAAPCNSVGLMKYLLAGIIGAVLVYAVFFVIFLLDDAIVTDEDVNRVLGLTVIGEIPDIGEFNGKKYGYRRKYGYGYRYGYGHRPGEEKENLPDNREPETKA